MVIEALKQKEKQRSLILLLIVILFLILLVIVLGRLRKRGFFISSTAIPPHGPKEIEINLNILKDPALKELEIFEEFSLPSEIGRENPFLPYEAEKPAPEIPEMPE